MIPVSTVGLDVVSQVSQLQGLHQKERVLLNPDRTIHTNPSITDPGKIIWNLVDLKL